MCQMTTRGIVDISDARKHVDGRQGKSLCAPDNECNYMILTVKVLQIDQCGMRTVSLIHALNFVKTWTFVSLL